MAPSEPVSPTDEGSGASAVWLHFFCGHPQFLRLWSAHTATVFGQAITTVALPLTAITVLHASPFEMGLLSTLTLLPQLLLGLFVGVWLDRVSRRRALIAANVLRAAVLVAIPTLAALHLLYTGPLLAAAFALGVFILVADVADLSMLPDLVEGQGLVRANSATVFSMSLANSTGPSVAGALAQGIGAPFALTVNGFLALVAAAFGWSVQEPPRPARPDAAAGTSLRAVRAEVAEGVRELLRTRTVRALAGSATIGAFAGSLQAPLLVLYFVRSLHLSSLLVGVAITASGAASVLGALLGPRITAHLGLGPTYVLGQAAVCVGGFTIAAIGGPGLTAVLLVALGQLMVGLGTPLYAIQQRAIRQALTPGALMGRVQASWRFFVYGAQAIGAILGGALATAVGLRTAIAVSASLMLTAVCYTLASPLRRLATIPYPAVQHE
ncbi:MFS transporter [Streptomyces sp. NPDC058441]|uniref:MFS transporter n=1 Tax=Streptomyces sp. NPDC058441 TaxID=3346502 RepID=UPI00364E8AA3